MFGKVFISVFVLGIIAAAAAFFSLVPISKETAKNSERTPATIPLAEPAKENPPEVRQVEIALPPMELPPVAAPVLPQAAATTNPEVPAKIEIKAEDPPTGPPAGGLENIPEKPTLPPLRETEILKAVVKIQCPTTDGLGKYVGSGFVMAGGTVITAAHVLKDSSSRNCDVIFPNDRRPVHYLRGITEDLEIIRQRHDKEGIDVAYLTLPALDSYPEAAAIFSSYPKISYPICSEPEMLNDRLLHFGYPSNYADQSYLSRQEGKAVIYADIKSVKNQLSEDQTYIYRTPVFAYTYDQSEMRSYMVSQVASFYGDSGGLAFNADKQCVIGPHRGGTIGKAAGENYSVFMNLGWEKAKSVLPN